MLIPTLLLVACEAPQGSPLGFARPKIDSGDTDAAPFAEAQSAVRTPRYLGVTTDTFDGNDGMAAISNACHAVWAYSRICTDQEIMLSRPYPVPGVQAWVLAIVAYNSGSSYTFAGQSLYNSNNCSSGGSMFSQTTNGLYGMYIDADGDLSTYGDCNVARAVACCG